MRAAAVKLKSEIMQLFEASHCSEAGKFSETNTAVIRLTLMKLTSVLIYVLASLMNYLY